MRMSTAFLLWMLFLTGVSADDTARKLSDILPQGRYQLIFSPVSPDLTNRNTAPAAFDISISYQNDQGNLLLGKRSFPIHFRGGGSQTIPAITFTILPDESPDSWFVTRIYSGSPSPGGQPGKIIGRAWTIMGWPSDADEFIFSLTKMD
jgi:hypothetical protein